MPSAYTSNGTGRCCQRKSAPSLLATVASGRIRWITNGIALMSAADSRLVRSAGLPNQPIEPQRLGDDRVRVAGVRTGLQRPAAAAQDRAQAAHLLALGVRRGQRARAAQVAVDLVEEQLLGGHADEAGVERLVEHRLHPRLLAAARPHLLAGGPVQAHGRGAHVGVADERGEVGAERERLERADVLLRGAPGLVLVDGADDVLARDRLDPAEEVAGVDAADVHGRERARAEQQRGHAVPHRLGQPGPVEHLDVVVGVDVDEARDHPLAVRRRPPRGSRSRRARRSVTTATRPSRTPRFLIAEAAPVPSNQRPPLMITSKVMRAWNRF